MGAGRENCGFWAVRQMGRSDGLWRAKWFSTASSFQLEKVS
jgi:hypothetical protein